MTSILIIQECLIITCTLFFLAALFLTTFVFLGSSHLTRQPLLSILLVDVHVVTYVEIKKDSNNEVELTSFK